MKSSILAFLIALAFLPQAATPQQPAIGVIAGTVVQAGTNEPVPGAQVTLTGGPASQPPLPSATTDDQGKFTLKNLEAGSYRLTFAATGFVKQAYGQRAFSTSGTPIVLEVGHMQSTVRMVLTPAANVSGKIHDTDGQPLGGIPVLMADYPYDSNGVRHLRTIGNAITDDRGEYRIYWVTPGKYYVRAGGPTSGPGSTRIAPFGGTGNPNNIPETYGMRYYPGVKEFGSAQAVDIAPGANLNGIDLTLELQKLYHIRGHLIDIRTGKAPLQGQVSVAAQPPLGDGGYGSNGYDVATGSFDIGDLVPGTYAITGQYWEDLPGTSPLRGGAGGANCGPPFRIFTDTVMVTVVDSDVKDVVITLVDNVIIGRIRTDTSALKLQQATHVVLQAVGNNSPGQNHSSDCVKDDGTFIVKNVKPGQYRISVSPLPLPQPSAIKDVRFGGIDAFQAPLKYFGPGTETIDILMSSKVAQVTGAVRDDKGQQVSDAQVVLMPAVDRSRFDLYQRRSSDRNGSFTFFSMPPGDYKLFAWEAIENYSWFDAEVVRPFEAKGSVVHVDESGKVNLNLFIIPAARPQ